MDPMLFSLLKVWGNAMTERSSCLQIRCGEKQSIGLLSGILYMCVKYFEINALNQGFLVANPDGFKPLYLLLCFSIYCSSASILTRELYA